MKLIEHMLEYSSKGIPQSFMVLGVAAFVFFVAWNICMAANDTYVGRNGLAVERTSLIGMGAFSAAGLAFMLSIIVFVYSMTGHMKGEVRKYRKDMRQAVEADVDKCLPSDTADIFRELKEDAGVSFSGLMHEPDKSIDSFLKANGL